MKDLALDALEWLRELWSPEWYVTRHPLTGRSVENRSFWSILGWFTAETARWSLAATLLAGLAALWLALRVVAGRAGRRKRGDLDR